MNFYSTKPLIRVLISIVFGLYLAHTFKNYSNYFFVVLLFFLLLFFWGKHSLPKKYSYRYRWIIGILLHVNMVGLTYLYGVYRTNTNDLKQNFEKSTFIGTIKEPLERKNTYNKTLISVLAQKKGNDWNRAEFLLLTYLDSSAAYSYGDLIVFHGKIDSIKGPKNPEEFDYKTYLKRQSIHAKVYLSKNYHRLLEIQFSKSLVRMGTICKNYLQEQLKKSELEKDQFALVSALLLGDKSLLDDHIKNAYIKSGIVHVMAVSGLHVGTLYLLASTLLFFLNGSKTNRRIKVLLLLMVLWSYVMVTGISPSVLRATLMMNFLLLGRVLNKDTDVFNLLAASAILLLLINPNYLYEVGFQLSYAAVLGILICYPFIEKFYHSKWLLLDKAWKLIAVSFSTQLFTFPIVLFYFHQFPNYFIVSNLLLIPIVLLSFYIAILTLIFSPVPFVWNILTFILKGILSFLNKSVCYIEDLPCAISADITFNMIHMILTYAIVFFLIFFIWKASFRYLSLALISAIFLLGYELRALIDASQQKKLIIYNVSGQSVYSFVDGRSNYIVKRDLQKEITTSKMMYSMKNNLLTLRILKTTVVTPPKNNTVWSNENGNLIVFKKGIQFGKHRFYSLDSESKLPPKITQKVKLQCLILSDNCPFELKQLIKVFDFKKLICDISNNPNRVERWKKESKLLGISLYDISTEGALVLDFN